MAKVQTNVKDDDAIKQSYRHKLFVEGSTDFDVAALKQLFDTHSDFSIEIIQLGKFENVSSAAKCLHLSHNNYYFLIDRDFKGDKEVEKSWKDFPSRNTNNLLIWRKRELENYFIDAEYIAKSRYIKPNYDLNFIKNQILTTAQKKLYSDVAQRIMDTFHSCPKISIGNDLNKEESLKCLIKSMEEMKNECKIPDQKKIINSFEETLQLYTGGGDTLEYGKGQWLDLISGKEIMNIIFNNYFEVKGDSGQTPVDFKDKTKKIVEDLLKNELNEQPQDFQELVKLMNKVIK